MKSELKFDIENFEIRPEFEVLKSYFSKIFKIKNTTVTLHAEFANRKLILQSPISNDLNKI